MKNLGDQRDSSPKLRMTSGQKALRMREKYKLYSADFNEKGLVNQEVRPIVNIKKCRRTRHFIFLGRR